MAEAAASRIPAWRSLRVRVIAAVSIALLAMVAAQGFQSWQQQQIGGSLTLTSRGYLPLAKIVGRLDNGRGRVENDVGRLLRGEARPFSGPTSATQLFHEEIERSLQEGRIHVAYARRNLTDSPDELAVLNKIDAQLSRIDERFAAWEANVDAFIAASDRGDGATVGRLQAALPRDGTQLADEIDTLSRLVDGRVDHLTRSTERAQQRATVAATGLGAVALALAGAAVVAVLVALRPIVRLTAEVQRIAAGDYSGHIAIRGGRDEIGILAAEFSAMIQALQVRDRELVDRADKLKRLSQYLVSVLDSLEDGLIVVDDGRVSLANPAAIRVWSAIVGELPPAPLISLPPGRHELTDRDRRYEAKVVAFGGAGRLIAVMDTTEATRTRDRLARSERLAAIGQMLAQITHEVRNPLNALSLNAELLAEELAGLDPGRSSDAWAPLTTVSSEIERLTEVTAHYLQLARRPRAQLSAEDLGGIIADVARLLAAELDQDGIALEIRQAALPPQIVDANQIKQAVLNIVRNAVEAGARNLVLAIDGDDSEVRVALSDDGPGMNADQLANATEPFWSTKANGTGLGLAITRQILEDHDGTVRIASEARGTTVTLALPYRPPA